MYFFCIFQKKKRALNLCFVIEPVRHEPVRRAELVCLALNRFSRVFLENLAKTAPKLTKMTDFGKKSWKNVENIAFFIKKKLNKSFSIFGFLRGMNRFVPHWFIYTTLVPPKSFSFKKNKINKSFSIFGFLRGMKRFVPHWFNYILRH